MKQNILIVMCCVCLLACRQTGEVSEQLQTVKVGKVQRMDVSQTHEYPFIYIHACPYYRAVFQSGRTGYEV